MRCKSFLAAIAALALALPTLADWDPPGDPNTKWVQMPNMDNGYNVLSTWGIYPDAQQVSKVVADDWMCKDPAPVTDIHVWGSWFADKGPDPSWPGTFRLTIYSDIPANQGTYSRPGSELWSRDLTPAVRFWEDSENEMFYDPNEVLPLSPETKVFQYNFLLDYNDYFWQRPQTVYWLSVQATGLPEGFYWGWKTSANHWNDAATWADLPITGLPAWEPLWDPRYPQVPLDMAFVITTPEPATYALIAGLGLAAFAGCRRFRAR